MKDEIAAGLRNALEREQSLEQATQSFVNAGYNPHEVAAAADFVSQGVSDIVYPNPKKLTWKFLLRLYLSRKGAELQNFRQLLEIKKWVGKNSES